MIHNITRQTIISSNTFYAKSFWARSRGMIARDFTNFDAMVFENCHAIHTFFMGIKLDVIFVDESYKICSLYESVSTWVPIVRDSNAKVVIELPVGTIVQSKSCIGDILTINTETLDKAQEEIIKNKVLNNTKTLTPFTEKH